MAQQFDCPKTETELRTLLDELYQQSRKARQEGNTLPSKAYWKLCQQKHRL